MDQLDQKIDCFNILSGQDEDKRAQDLRKLLILAGIKVETELADPETVALIQKVLDDFSKTPHVDDDELLFASRLADFESKADKSNGRKR